ncbi:MAG: type 1 glutamine amidotransferase [Jatrophihabitans sp.]
MVTTRALILQLDRADPPGRLADWLTDAGLAFDVCDISAGAAVPSNLSDYDALVVLGGAMSASDDGAHSFLASVRELLRAAVRNEVPTLAICLGAQLLALAHGGRIEPNPEGPELGAQLIAKRSAGATDPLFGPMPITPDVIQWHYDTISALPAGAVHLANSPMCENQAFRLGRLAWGLQFHFETTTDVVEAWARTDAQQLQDFDLDLILRRSAAIHGDLEEVWRPFVSSFADLVRDPDSVAAAVGPATSTAAPVTDPAAIRAALAAEANASRASLPMPTMRRPGG